MVATVAADWRDMNFQQNLIGTLFFVVVVLAFDFIVDNGFAGYHWMQVTFL